uniref:ATP synthase subunit a n=1 Tax=Nierstraszella lineata TaxID=515354 RepID=A0A6H1PHE5_9MOLL|nr:ATP synthase F0 subunit 6 [Nierstraszella lineata]QIZ12571.1 ATP synthase F0 subunit 6 [Nierstraszella lineata]
MMTDIFSGFDEQNLTFLASTLPLWSLTFLPMILLHWNMWVTMERWTTILLKPINFITMQVERANGHKLPGFLLVISTLFLLIIMCNLSGLAPYIFSLTSHLVFSFSLGFLMWTSLISSGICYSLTHVVAHFLPSGAPSVLNPFLVLIETVSICVRSITLCIRLTANMSAGHIILGLVGSYMSISLFNILNGTMVILAGVEVFYFMFEMGICLIQAYIFCLLLTLYSNDHPLKW